MHTQLLSCVEALLKVLGSEVKVISQPLFDLIITVLALSTEQQVRDKVALVVSTLLGVESSVKLLYGTGWILVEPS